MKRLICVSIAALMVAPPASAASRNFDKFALIAGLGLAGAAVAAGARAKRTEMVFRRGETSFPEFGEESWARPGEAVYANYNFDAAKAARTTLTANLSGTGAYTRTTIPSGSTFFLMVTGKFCRPSGTQCLEDRDRDGDFDKAGRDMETDKKIDLPYDLEEIQFDASDKGFRSELVFQGVGAGVLYLAYREFVNDMARPAFTQEIRYDFEGPTTIAFQTLEIDVLEAGNMGIRYKVREASSEKER